MTNQVRMLKLSNQDIIMTTIVGEDDDFIYVDNPSLVYAEQTPEGTTKISYIPWMPFYENQKSIAIFKSNVVVGSKEKVNKELADRYIEMVSPKTIMMPNKGLIGI